MERTPDACVAAADAALDQKPAVILLTSMGLAGRALGAGLPRAWAGGAGMRELPPGNGRCPFMPDIAPQHSFDGWPRDSRNSSFLASFAIDELPS